MRIPAIRRISQVFFLLLFLWFCVVATLGERGWELRGWPVNWFLQLDPLVALGTALTTRTVYAGLLWAVLTVVLTVVLGRFFCGWLCPFGTLHQAVGWLGRRKQKLAAQVKLNAYRPAQAIKYYLLVFLLGLAAWQVLRPESALLQTSLQTGLLDPIPLLQRSVNLVVVALADPWRPRAYEGAWLIGLVLAATLGLNLVIPRFYCRFLCPLGALFGVLARWSVWRIAKTTKGCTDCGLCARHCEGGCEPEGRLRWSECLLCANCLTPCREDLMTYRTAPSAAGEEPGPTLSRRAFLLSAGAGLAAGPTLRLGRTTGINWRHAVIRPPGALAEADFLARCIKCGQCMRVCPTNIIQPALLQAGLEGLWTPVLNFRIGTSGCQPDCVACGHLCPTAAIRPLLPEEKRGRGDFQAQGPVRLGLAFIDRGRCLPWAMGTPCIVCQEVCPVAPKAIHVREVFEPVRAGAVRGAGDLVQRTPEGPAEVRLQQPYVDPQLCIGCGICEHECPVSGLRAIRVTAENETREPEHRMSAG